MYTLLLYLHRAGGKCFVNSETLEQKESGHAPSSHSSVSSEVGSKGEKQGLNRTARLQGTWQGPRTWHQVICSPPVGWTQVAVVKANSPGDDRETALACRVGREWGQRAAWWALGTLPAGALRREEGEDSPVRRAAPSRSPVPGAQAFDDNALRQ